MFTGGELTRLIAMLTMLVVLIGVMDRLRRPGSMNWFMLVTGSKAAPNPPASGGAPSPKANPPLKDVDECREVDTSLLTDIRDKTPRQAEDAAAINQMLCVAATVPPAELAGSARRDVLFANLYEAPASYRGRPIHMFGVLRRLLAHDRDPRVTAHGLGRYYEAWIFPEDQAANPVVVLFTACPPGLEPGYALKENVAFDGYFVKLLAYQSQEGEWRAAPMFAGRTLEWQRVEPETMSQGAWVVAFGLVAAVGIGTAAFWWQGRRDRHLLEELRPSVGPAFEAPEDPGPGPNVVGPEESP